MDVTIPLQSVPQSQIGKPEDYAKVIQDEYVKCYLDKLGVNPTAVNRAKVASNAPLQKCRIEATWADRNSAVASSLKIFPRATRKEATDKMQDVGPGGDRAKRAAQWCGQAAYASVAPPDVVTVECLEKAAKSAKSAGGKAASGRGNMDGPMSVMRRHDKVLSREADASLTEELERVRRMARGAFAKGDADAELEACERRERQEQEMANLKQKFIMPFACEHEYATPAGKTTVVRPWQSSELHNVVLEIQSEISAEVAEPIAVTLEELSHEAKRYANDCLPLWLLTTRQDKELFDAIRLAVCTPEAVRLMGLMAHLLYWNMFGHRHRHSKRLPESSKQSLLLTIHEIWGMLTASHRDPLGMSLVVPVLVLCLKRGIEYVFISRYPKLTHDPLNGPKVIEQINLLFMRLFDPDCVLASFGALEGTSDCVRARRKIDLMLASQGKGACTRSTSRLHRATPLMHSVLGVEGGFPCDSRTRKLLGKSASDAVLKPRSTTLRRASSSSDRLLQKPRMDEWRRQALFRAACDRLKPAHELKASALGEAPPGPTGGDAASPSGSEGPHSPAPNRSHTLRIATPTGSRGGRGMFS